MADPQASLPLDGAAPPPPAVPPAAAGAPPPPAPAAAAPAPASSLIAEAAAAPAGEAAPAVPATEAPAAPVAVEVKVPEGFTVDAPVLEGFRKVAAEVGLDSAKAQKVFDLYAQAEVARAKAAEAAFVAEDAKWTEEIRADPAIGGDKLAQSQQLVRRAIQRMGGLPVAQVLHQAGLGNHPTLVRAFVSLGRMLAEDSIAGTSVPASSAPPKSLEALLYPTMQPKKEN